MRLIAIIAPDLSQDQESTLPKIFKENKEAIVWTLGDIKGISSSIFQQKINFEESTKHYKDH